MQPIAAKAPGFQLRPVHIALIYIAVAVTWIVVSDRVLTRVDGSTVFGLPWQTVKGIFFVITSGVLIYFLTRSATLQSERHARRADESEHRYRTLIETSPDGVFVQTGGVIRFANEAAAKILGADSARRMLGTQVLDLAADSDREQIAERIRRINEHREPAPPVVERLRRFDKKEAVVEVTASPIEYVGEPGAIVLMRDVSERLVAEEALRESEQRFRRMAANIPGAIFRYTLAPDGTDRVEYMSPGCKDIWEAEPEEIVRDISILWTAIHPDDVEPMRRSVDESARRGKPWSLQWRITTRSGKQKWLHGFGQPNIVPTGEVVWDSVIFDITDKKSAEDTANQAARRLEHIMQNVSDGFFLMDRQWKYTVVNQSGAQLVGQTPDAMLGRTLQEVFPEVVGTEWEAAYSRVMRTGETESLEAYYEPFKKWFEARIDATDDGLAVFFRDTSERKRAEQRQQLMMRELDHRVKNNLAAVLAIAESSLREAESLPDFSESFVGRIRAMANMHSLLAAQRWEGVGFINMIHAVVAPYTDRDGHRLELEGPDLRLPSNAAPAICMTLHELATNAVKHGALASDRGRVRVEWTYDETSQDLRIVWSERDGATTAAAIAPGFGMDLLQGVIPYELNGDIDLSFSSDGLDAAIFIPGDSLRAASLLRSPPTEAAK